MNILITGGSGFIGANLIKQLLEETKHHLLNLDKLTYAGCLKSLEDVENHPRYRFVRGDICDKDLLQRLINEFDPMAIIHLAAESHVDRSIRGPSAFMDTNIQGTYALLEACLDYWQQLDKARQSMFRLVHVSTDEVYGALRDGDPPFLEESPYRPNSPYSASKACSDHLVRAWGKTYSLPVLITHCSNNYGPYQHPEKLIPVVILHSLSGQSIPIYGKGDQVRDWIHVSDHCKALQRVLEKGECGEVYNIGGRQEWCNRELVEAICNELDKQRPREDGKPHRSAIEFVEDRPAHDFRYAINGTKIKSELGWQSVKSWSDGLKSTVSWYLNNETWWRPLLERH